MSARTVKRARRSATPDGSRCRATRRTGAYRGCVATSPSSTPHSRESSRRCGGSPKHDSRPRAREIFFSTPCRIALALAIRCAMVCVSEARDADDEETTTMTTTTTTNIIIAPSGHRAVAVLGRPLLRVSGLRVEIEVASCC